MRTVPFTIVSPRGDGNTLAGRIEISRHGIAVYFEGYGLLSMACGYGAVWIELGKDGAPEVDLWDDINTDDLTHQISLAGAHESLSTEASCD